MSPKPVYLHAAVEQLARGKHEVYCLIPDDCWEIKPRRIAFVRIMRTLRAAGIAAHIWWAWYREDASGEPETVFRLTRKETVIPAPE